MLGSPKRTNNPCAGHIPELDGLRGVCIVMILLHHFAPKVESEWLYRLIHVGWIGVDLFFAISGFLITTILLGSRGNPHYYKNFYMRRAIRIFPLYYVFLFAAFAVIPLAQGGPYSETEFIQQTGSPWWYILYCGNLRESLFKLDPQYFLAVTWSLCIEEHFYLLFPLLVARLSRRNLTACLWGCVAISPIIRTLFLWVSPDNERIQYVATICRVDSLALGSLLAIYLASERPVLSKTFAKRLWLCSCYLLVLMLVSGVFDRTQSFFRIFGYSVVAVAAASTVLVVLVYRRLPQMLWLRRGVLASLGRLSYGIYLLQRPAEIALLKLLGKLKIEATDTSLWLCLVKCEVAIGVAWLSWTLFEEPILRLKRLFPTKLNSNETVAPPIPDARGLTDKSYRLDRRGHTMFDRRVQMTGDRRRRLTIDRRKHALLDRRNRFIVIHRDAFFL